MINDTNIYNKGMLISLRMGSYAGRRRMDKEQLKELPTEIVRGVHDLFDLEYKKLLQEISAFDRHTRHIVWHMCIPFPVDGIYFMPAKKISEAIEMLELRKTERYELVNQAVENYEAAIETFAEKYPEYYQRARNKYLSRDRFHGRFYFNYQFLNIAAPDEKHAIISPELYKEEVRKFKETIQQMKSDVVSTIYSELLESTNRLKKQCTEGKPSQRTLNSVNEFLKKIDEVYSDFVDRDDLVKAIKKVKAQVLGVTAESLRASDDTREKFRKSVSSLVSEIKNLPDIPLKRAIEL